AFPKLHIFWKMRASIQRQDAIGMKCLVGHDDISVGLEYLPAKWSIDLPGNSRRKTVRFGIVVHVMRQKIVSPGLGCGSVRNEFIGWIADCSLRCGLSD